MSNINKAAVLNPLPAIVDNIVDYIPRASTSKFGVVAIGSGINIDSFGRIYLDTKEYSDRLTAIEAQAASNLATQKSEVAAAIAQVNLAQSQTITALTLEVSNLKTNLTASISATKTDLINRADQLAQNVANITQQLTQDKATFTQEIQDALDYLKDDASVASALRTPRKIQGVAFDGTRDITLPIFSTQTDGLVPKRVGATTTKYLREDGTWVIPPDTTYPLLTKAIAETGTATTANTISAQVLKDAIKFHTPTIINITGNAGTATKLQTPRTINGVLFDGTQDISLPEPPVYSLPTASASVLGGIKVGTGLSIVNSVLSVSTLNQNTTGNAATASKLQTPRTIALTGSVTGSASFDGSANAAIATTITGLGVANGIATLDSSGQVPSTQLPSYVDDVLEYLNVAAFPTTGEAGKIYVETTGNTTYRWSGSGYVKITSGEVSSVAGKTGVVTLTKADVGLTNVDNTADSAKSVASAAKLTTARAIGGIAFDGTANIILPGVNAVGNQNTSGNAGSASKLATARTLTVGRTGKAFDGSINIAWTATEVLPTATSGQFLKFDGTTWIASVDNDTTYSAMSQAEANTGTDTANRVITAAVLKEAIQTHAPAQSSSITGNAASATKLETARTINGVSFDGTSNIEVPIKTIRTTVIETDDLSESVFFRSDAGAGTIGIHIQNPVDSRYAYQLSQDSSYSSIGLKARVKSAGTWSNYKSLAFTDSNITGSAASLATARTLSWTGDATGSLSFDGSANVSTALTLANSGVTAGTYKSVTVDAKGRVTAGNDVITGLITSTTASGTANVATGNTNTFLNITEKIGTNTSTVGSSSQITGAGTVTVASDAAGKITITGSQTITGNAATATKLAAARTINGVSFDGSANIDLPVFATDKTGLVPARIGATVTKFLREDGTWVVPTNTTYSAMSATEANTGTATTAQLITAAVLKGAIQTHAPTPTSVVGNAGTATKLSTARMIGGISFDGSANIDLPGVNSPGNQSTTGNAATATKLTTARTINGTSFDGTANITTANWGTARTLTIGSSGKSVNGSANVSWTLAEMGAAAASHTHDYLPLTGGTLNGELNVTGNITATGNVTAYSDQRLKDNINRIESALDKVKSLNGVTFTRNDLASKDKRYVGLIAQEVQSVIPEAVTVHKDVNQTLSVDYQGLVGLLVEAVKELSDRIEMLEG